MAPAGNQMAGARRAYTRTLVFFLLLLVRSERGDERNEAEDNPLLFFRDIYTSQSLAGTEGGRKKRSKRRRRSPPAGTTPFCRRCCARRGDQTPTPSRTLRVSRRSLWCFIYKLLLDCYKKKKTSCPLPNSHIGSRNSTRTYKHGRIESDR